MPELLYGRRHAGNVPLARTPLDLAADAPLVLADAEIFYTLFEMRMAAAEARLPRSLHPSVPALMGITFIKAASGPLGAFTLAYLGIACRTGIKPRHFVTGAFCEGEQARAFFAGRYGFAIEAAEVAYHETYDRVRGHIGRDGRSLLDLVIAECIPLIGAGATIKYSPPLNAADVAGKPALVQFEAAYEFKRVLRGRPQALIYDAAGLGDAEVAPTHPIAGSHAQVDLHLLPARFQVDLEVPAEAGGASRIPR
jgi:hypothetical protein